MRIFETRHGQVAPKNYYGNDPSLPVGDIALSPLGKEQARCLGKRLKELNFNGVIFSSPYDRTMKTASIVAEELGLKVMPLACLHEIVFKVNENFQGATAETLAKNYPCVEGFTLPQRWWGDSVESLSDVIERVKNGLEPILASLPEDTDVLIVGHAATSVAIRHVFGCTNDNRGFHWNCHLSLLRSPSGEKYMNDCSHLPEDMRTGNSILHTVQKELFEQGVNSVRDLLKSNTEQTVLHIANTRSENYAYYRRLIEEIKPSVIIHTGNLDGEINAGENKAIRPYWKESAQVMLKIMEQSGSRVIVVAGNNDIEEELHAISSTVEIVKRNTVLELYGKKVFLSHEFNIRDENIEADVYFYNHALTDETRTPTDNQTNGTLFYNATWGPSLYCFDEHKGIVLPVVYI